MRHPTKVLLLCLLLAWLPGPLGAVVIPEKEPSDGSATDVKSPRGLLDGPILLGLNPPLRDEPLAADTFAQEPVEEQPQDEQQAEEEPSKTLAPDANEAADDAQMEMELEPLSEPMIALRDRVRRTIAGCFHQSLNTRNNTPAQIMQVCLAFGCDAEVHRDGPSGSMVNGFTCLCWNYPCAGYHLLKAGDRHIIARIGHGLQERPGQFLAVLALSRVPREYPLRAGGNVCSVQDLVEGEKLSCRSGSDLSLKLIGLSRYVADEETWKNDLGEDWSLQRLLKEEVDRASAGAPCGGIHRLMGLSYAVDRRIKREQPLSEQYRRAKNYVDEFQQYALSLQNPDGSWNPMFFRFRGAAGTALERLRSTGHILQWLVFSLPEDQLQEPQIVKSVGYVTGLLGSNQRHRRNQTTASSREIAARMHAVRALGIYDRRVFKPHDPKPEPEQPQEVADKPAGKPTR